jgi:septal ring factor EnvC (AmiA/AmiB activator)
MSLGLAGIAEAQKRNDKDIRDAVRSLDSKIDDFESNLRYQMQSSSQNNGQIADAGDEIRDLRDSVQHFQDNYDRKRENRDA